MRELDPFDLGVLLSLFAVLLIFFGIDFRVSQRSAHLFRRRALLFAGISLLGEVATVVALILTWVALFLPPETERVDTILVFVPGSVAILCAVVLTVESAAGRALGLLGRGRKRKTDAAAPRPTDDRG